MPGIVQVEGMDPVPDWRLKVWAELGPKHRMMARDRTGKYVTVFHTASQKDAMDWWLRVQRREGTDWKGWTWLAYYGWRIVGTERKYGIRRLMLFPSEG